MKKQVILGLVVMISLLVLVSSAQAAVNITINDPGADESISGTYTLNATTSVPCSWVNFSWSTNNITRFLIGTNDTEGTEFTLDWDTSEFCTGNYTLNATTNWTDYDVAFVNFSIDNSVITLVSPAASATISGEYTLNATTTATRAYVNFSWSNDSGVTWTEIGSNDTEGTWFTLAWNTSNVSDGTYWINATTNCTILDERTETDENQGVVVDNIPAATVDSPEFSTIMIAGLIGLLSATAILLRKKKE